MRKLPRGTYPMYNPRPKSATSVREIIRQINEHDITGNTASQWASMLQNRKKVPVKVISFQDTDRRPGYIGTFTKTSRVIRPRKPFAPDRSLFDYDYDSEADWDDEVNDGDDVNSDGVVSEAGDEDDDDAGSLVGDGGWMCEDNEIEFVDGYDGEDGANQEAEDILKATRRASEKHSRSLKDSQARRKAVKALPDVKSIGLGWEKEIGTASLKTLQQYRMVFLNGAQLY